MAWPSFESDKFSIKCRFQTLCDNNFSLWLGMMISAVTNRALADDKHILGSKDDNRKMVSAAGSKQGQMPGVKEQGKLFNEIRKCIVKILVGNFFQLASTFHSSISSNLRRKR